MWKEGRRWEFLGFYSISLCRALKQIVWGKNRDTVRLYLVGWEMFFAVVNPYPSPTAVVFFRDDRVGSNRRGMGRKKETNLYM